MNRLIPLNLKQVLNNIMKDFTDLQDWTPKRLRTLRNNLNNRLQSFKNVRNNAPELQKSHALAGMTQKQCEDLLVEVQRILKVKDV